MVSRNRIKHSQENGVEGKVCSSCATWYPLNQYSPSTTSSDGLLSHCHKCCAASSRKYNAEHRDMVAIKDRRWRDANPDKVRAQEERRIARERSWRLEHPSPPRIIYTQKDGVNGKVCPRCQQWKPVSAYGKDSKASDGLRSACTSCRLEENKLWRQAHPEKAKELADRNRHNHPETQKRLAQRYRERHRDALRAKVLRRRALKRDAPGAGYTTHAMIRARWEMFGNRCWICGAPATATDHVKPIVAGGGNWPCNLRPICRSCNSSKGAKWPFFSDLGQSSNLVITYLSDEEIRKWASLD